MAGFSYSGDDGYPMVDLDSDLEQGFDRYELNTMTDISIFSPFEFSNHLKTFTMNYQITVIMVIAISS